MDDTKPRGLLVCDPDTAFLSRIARDAQGAGESSEGVSTPLALEEKIKLGMGNYSGVFVNPEMFELHGLRVVQKIRKLSPTSPVFFLLEPAKKRLSEVDTRRMTVSGYLNKPVTYREMRTALQQRVQYFNLNETLASGEGSDEQVGEEFDGTDDDFLPIFAKDFVAGSESYFDVYVRVNAARYLKVLRAGDAFSADRIAAYISKNTEFFYIRKKVQEHYLRYCDVLTSAIVENSAFQTEVKVTQVANLGEETAKFLRLNGLSEATVGYARQFAKRTHALAKALKLEHHDCIRKYLYDNERLDHSVSVAMVASVIATNLNFDSERGANIIGLAALLHDVGLQALGKELREGNPATFSPADRAIYRQHPTIGKEMLRPVSGIEPIVLQAVEQHHERRNGKGFPYGLAAGKVNLVAEIIGMSEEYVEYIRLGGPNVPKLAEQWEQKCRDEFSASVVATFKMFFKDSK